VDDATLQFYRRNAEAYAQREITSRHARLAKFLALRIGGDSAEMLARGYDVTPTDGSPEMADVASRRLGRPVGTLLFHDLDAVEGYSGVWANACLLHVPREDLAKVLSSIWRALKPGGAFYASYKAGAGGGRDSLNRYYNYPTEDWLRATYAQAGAWIDLSIDSGEVRGFDDAMAEMLFVLARKSP
jgi:SAM-dependent methyltransferase